MTERKPQTYFIRPHYVYFSLASIVAVHILAYITNVPAFVQLIINSLSCVYVGSMSNSKIKFNKELNKLEKVVSDDNNEAMTKKDAAMFPIYLSAYLFGLYILFKVVDKNILQVLLTGFFSLMGIICLMTIIEEQTERYFSTDFTSTYIVNRHYRFKIFFLKMEFPIKFTRLNLASFTATVPAIKIYLLSRNWIANNIFGIAFCITGIANFTVLPNFKVGMVMLWGLFFYDIFWVFGTDVMLTVAKSIDAPIKLMFPYNWLETPTKYSMLGLGDIVIPGVFVALCLKYDVDRRIKNSKKLSDIDTSYFNWCFGGYTLGMITTFVVMVVFEHPQPALLFLVPGCTFSVILKAYLDNNLKGFWAYEQEDLKKTKVEQKKPKVIN